MSRTTLYVRFPDEGTMRYGIFDEDTGIAWTQIFDTFEEAWDAWSMWVHELRTSEDANPWDYQPGFGVVVEVATEHLPVWRATATHEHLTSNHEPLAIPLWDNRGIPPEWAHWPNDIHR